MGIVSFNFVFVISRFYVEYQEILGKPSRVLGISLNSVLLFAGIYPEIRIKSLDVDGVLCLFFPPELLWDVFHSDLLFFPWNSGLFHRVNPRKSHPD